MGTIRYRNLATDPEIVQDVQDNWVPLIRRTRRQRQLLNDQWLRYDNLWSARPDSQSYAGRTRTYLATGRRVIENWVTKLKQDLFPQSGRWVQTSCDNINGEDQIAVWDALWKKFLLQMKIRRQLTPWLRMLVTMGTAPLDLGWRFSAEMMEVLRRRADGTVQPTMDEIVRYLGPTIRPIPPWRWYVYPASVNDLEDCSLIFEDFLMDPRRAEALGETAISEADESLGMQFENVEELLKTVPSKGTSAGASDKFAVQQRQLAARGLLSPAYGQDDPHQQLIMCKSFIQAQYDDEPLPVWYQLVLGGDDVVVSVRRGPFTYGLPTYLCGKFLEKEEEFYGYGVASAIDTLQYQANDLANQSGDALTWSLNPVVGVDPSMVQDHTTLKMRPGAKWLIRNPRQSIQPIEFPKDSAAAGQAAVQQIIGLMNDVANVSPYGGAGAVGRSKGRAVTTLGGMQLIAGDALVQVADITQGIEDAVLNPMLSRIYDMTIQCLDVPLALKTEGVRGAAMVQRQIVRDDLVGEFDFSWLASASNFNLQVRGAQLNQFVQVAGRLPPQMLAQENIRINWKYLLQAVWSMGFQLPDADRVIQSNVPVVATAPDIENELLRIGRFEDVMVSPADKDADHIRSHLEAARTEIEPVIQAAFTQHIQRHELAMVAKQVMAQQQAMGQMQGAPQGQPGLGAFGGSQMSGGSGASNGSGALALPNAPGRLGATGSIDDLMRQLPRGNGMMDAGMGSGQ